MLLFVVPYRVVLTFEHADEILRCDYSMKAHEQSFLLSKVILTFVSLDEILQCNYSSESS